MHFTKPSITDANPFRRSLRLYNFLKRLLWEVKLKNVCCRRQSAVEPPREPPFDVQSPVIEMYCEEYNMRHPRRGIALVLNHVNFETEDVRDGSDKDCERLKGVLKNLGFEVRVHTDLAYDKVLSVLRSGT